MDDAERYEKKPLEFEGHRVGTVFEFAEPAVSFYQNTDEGQEHLVVVEYEEDYFVSSLPHDVADSVVGGSPEALTHAVAFAPSATPEVIAAVTEEVGGLDD